MHVNIVILIYVNIVPKTDERKCSILILHYLLELLIMIELMLLQQRHELRILKKYKNLHTLMLYKRNSFLLTSANDKYHSLLQESRVLLPGFCNSDVSSGI